MPDGRASLRRLLGLSLTALLLTLPLPAMSQQIGVAGSPVSSIEDKNFNRLFGELRSNGISIYLPTFQYQEVPRPKSLGFERDFAAPCSPDAAPFRALRASGMKLLIPGEFVYPDPSRIAHIPSDSDPLAQIIACAGRDAIAGITTYDEAAFHGVSLEAVKAFYQRVKQVDPSLPVFMVHAPIVADKHEFRSNGRIANYLETLRSYSAFSDVVGFDVYPVPAAIAKIATPMSNRSIVTAEQVVPDYMAWLNQAAPNKKKLIVLQGFSYTNLYEDSFLKKNVPLYLRNAIQPPTQDETHMMFQQARSAGVSYVFYWGASSLPDTATAPWPSILEMGRSYGR